MSDERTKIEIPDGYYDAKPTFCGLTTSKNGHAQFAIECAIDVPQTDGTVKTLHLTKFNGLSPDELPNGGSPLQFTMEDAERCGCNVDADIREWMVDQTKAVRVKVENDGEYGPKLRSIFEPGAGAGGLIKKQAMDEARKAAVASDLNARIRAMRAKAAQQNGGRKAPTKAAPKHDAGPPNDFGDVDTSDLPF